MVNTFLPQILLALVGVLFSGYLTISRLVFGICPLNEGCPRFLGYPACWFGLGFFLTLLILSLLKKIKLLRIVSGLAIIFALYTTYNDLTFPNCPGGVCRYSLLLPTCIYGLVMFLGVFIFSLPRRQKKP